MTITIEIKPEVEAELALRAAAEGLDLPAYAATLLERIAQLENSNSRHEVTKSRRPSGRKSLSQLFAESPFRGLDLDFERDSDVGRDFRL